MDNLFPESLDDEEMKLEQINEAFNEEPVGYRKSISFDERLGDFQRDGAKKLVESSGIEAWIQWCLKILKTKRYVCQAYSDDVGIDLEQVFQAESREEVEILLEKEIVEALEADPYGRTEVVQSVEFQWQEDDSLEVFCQVLGIDSNEIKLQTKIER